MKLVSILIFNFLSFCVFAQKERTYPTDTEIKSYLSTETTLRYVGESGYHQFAIDYFFGNLEVAYKYTKLAIGHVSFSNLLWGKKYYGNYSEYLVDLKLLTENKHNRFFGKRGYLSFARTKKYKNQLRLAHSNASTVLKESFSKYNWGRPYTGKVSDFLKERSQLFNKESQIKKIFKGPIGYARYADRKYEGNMEKAYKNLSVVLSEAEFKELGWHRVFYGSSTEFNIIREILHRGQQSIDFTTWYGKKDGLDRLVMEYKERFIELYPNKKLDHTKLRQNVRASVSSYESQELGWDRVDKVTRVKRNRFKLDNKVISVKSSVKKGKR